MSNTSPSKIRYRARKAYCPGCDPLDEFPWKPGSWGYDMYMDDWLDGWKRAEKEWEEEQASKRPEEQACPCCGRPYDEED